MDENKNDALILGTSSTSSSTSSNTDSTNNIIVQNSTKNQGKHGGKRKWSYNGHRMLLYNDKVRSLAIKCYDEQLIYGWQYTQDAIRSMDKKEYHVIGICHDVDTYSEDGSPWKTAFEKRHFHIILRLATNNRTERVNVLMKKLGVEFRPGLDDELWKNHGVETVDNYAGYTAYLTHETADAIRDGKVPYDRNRLVSNLTPDELDEVREGYFRLTDGRRKASHEDMVSLDEMAFRLGYDLKNFQAWYDTLSFEERSNAKMRVVKESYERGVNKRIEEKPEVLRLCVFIEGEHNSGKTYSSRKALEGYRIKTIEGGGTGKFDDLKPDHDAIIVSDDTCPNLLNMCDNYICRAYRRQKDNPAWTGRFFIVTSNLTFDEWLEECKLQQQRHIDAMHSRFFICKIQTRADGTNYLALVSPSTRGSRSEQQERAGMFMAFQKKFNESLANYKPNEDFIDYAALIDPEHRTPDEQARVDEKEWQEANGIKLNSVFNQSVIQNNALKKFGKWFWISEKSPWRECTKGNTASRRNEDAARQFIRNLPDAELRSAIQRFADYKIVGRFPIKYVREVVEWEISPFVDMITSEE